MIWFIWVWPTFGNDTCIYIDKLEILHKKQNICASWSTLELKVRLVPLNMLSPLVTFADLSKAVLL